MQTLALAAVATYLTELETLGRSTATLTSYRHNVEHGLEDIADLRGIPVEDLALGDVTRTDVVDALTRYRTAPDGRSGKLVERSATTLERRLSSLRGFFVWARGRALIEACPTDGVQTLPIPRRIPKAISMQDIAALFAAAQRTRNADRDSLIVGLAFTCGLRLNEMSNIRLQDLYPTPETAQEVLVTGKGSRERVVPIPAPTRALLAGYLALRETQLREARVPSDKLFIATYGGTKVELTREGMAQVFDRLLEQTGLKVAGRRAHMARHSFATHGLRSRAFDIEELRTILGHSDVAITSRYISADPSKLARASEDHPLAAVIGRLAEAV